jgi:hypothetical protein
MGKIRAKEQLFRMSSAFFQIYENVSHSNLKLFTTNKNIQGHVKLLVLPFGSLFVF